MVEAEHQPLALRLGPEDTTAVSNRLYLLAFERRPRPTSDRCLSCAAERSNKAAKVVEIEPQSCAPLWASRKFTDTFPRYGSRSEGFVRACCGPALIGAIQGEYSLPWAFDEGDPVAPHAVWTSINGGADVHTAPG